MESILGFIQHLVLKYQIGDKNAKNVKPVNDWVQEEIKDIQDVEIKNFTTRYVKITNYKLSKWLCSLCVGV